MIVITGASGHLGSGLVQGLAGVDQIVAVYNTRAPIMPPDSQVATYQVDVTDEAETQRFADRVAAQATRITLVNLAGIPVQRLAVDLNGAEWDRVVAVSLKGSFLMAKAFLKPMIRARWGRIINVSSVVAREGTPGTSAYAAAKAGLEGLTRTLSSEYARHGILVNCLTLGYFAGGMTSAFSDEQRKAIVARIPVRRFGDVSDLTEAVKYLMRADYVTGTSIRIDGGLT